MDKEALRAIERLISDFAWFADRGEWAELAALFIDTGTLVLNDQTMQGRSEIIEQLQQRSRNSTRVTRHVWSNLRASPLAFDAVAATVSQLTFEQSEPGAGALVRVSDVADAFQRDALGVWRFALRRISRVMTVG